MYKKVFKIKEKYLIFPISNKVKKHKVWVSEEDKVLYDLDLRLSQDYEYLTWLNVEQKVGKEITFSCEEMGVCDLIYQSKDLPNDLYEEKYRPYFHFTPSRGWVNDPNGLFFANGKYHIFYQHNPYDVRWGNMHWGHSCSEDLFSWKDEGEALFPDENGTMFSGCAIYDKNNVTGLGTKENPPSLLYYTCAGGDNSISSGKKFTVCIAYSIDGINYVKYDKNPVVENIVFGNRDPKVVWCEEYNKWIMVLFLQPFEFAFLSSTNLIDWKQESVIDLPTMNECPDFFPLEDTGKWVFLSGADFWGDKSVGKYVIGDFDGNKMSNLEGPYLIDLGREFYSLQTFDNDRLNRRILLGWRTRNFFVPEVNKMPFNGEYSIPTTLTSCYIDGKLRIKRYPVEEFFNLAGEELYSIENKCFNAVEEDAHVVDLSAGESYSVELSFKPKQNSMTVILIAGEEIVYNLETQSLLCLGKSIKVPTDANGMINLLIARDVVSLEVFVQKGEYVLSGYIKPSNEGINIDVYRGINEEMNVNIKAIYRTYKR